MAICSTRHTHTKKTDRPVIGICMRISAPVRPFSFRTIFPNTWGDVAIMCRAAAFGAGNRQPVTSVVPHAKLMPECKVSVSLGFYIISLYLLNGKKTCIVCFATEPMSIQNDAINLYTCWMHFHGKCADKAFTHTHTYPEHKTTHIYPHTHAHTMHHARTHTRSGPILASRAPRPQSERTGPEAEMVG